MTREEIIRLMQGLSDPELMETHISWIILSGKYAYKIKKPVTYSFLDFSTLEKRAFYCHREIELNRRLTKGIYLEVIAVRQTGGVLSFGPGAGKVLDYAVKMQRLDGKRHMTYLLEHSEVSDVEVCQIAQLLAPFHRKAQRIDHPPDLDQWTEQLRDIRSVIPYLIGQLGEEVHSNVEEAIHCLETDLPKHAKRIHQRWEAGFYIDGHGDLHSGNIFLLETPVLFDCIEFNDEFRHLDVLDELAFFCLDLEYYHRQSLEQHFMECYQKLYPCLLTPEDHWLFLFFKWYRANVKLKVQSLKAMQASHPPEQSYRLKRALGYYQLFKKYSQRLIRWSKKS